jgi:glycosyltransferase involved in cell wall biosynthesis
MGRARIAPDRQFAGHVEIEIRMIGLSILIPARNEQFLTKTVEDILAHAEGETEVVVILDGAPANPPLPTDPRIRVVTHTESIGQRAATNEAARLSTAKYVMKVDAHCAFDQGFDVKLMQPYESGELAQDVTTIPRMYNLHVFNWRCNKCGNETYQGGKPTGCEQCDNTTDFEIAMVWKSRLNRRSDFARFDHDLHFQYWGAYEKRNESKKDLAESLCFVGACFMMPRVRFWELGGCDERHGSWGQFGVEFSCKSWLSGGRMVVNKRTWFAHLFRTQPGFGFPYPLSGSAQDRAREHSRWLWQGGNWEGAIHPLSWLLEKFAPVPEWDEYTKPVRTNVTKGLLYYTDNRLDGTPLANAVRKQIKSACNGHELISVSREPLDFGRNLTIDAVPGILTMFKQILFGLESGASDVVYFTEHDLLYHPSHFDFIPPREDTFYYNLNVWRVRASDGYAVRVDFCQQQSGLCAYRKLLIEHYRKRVERIEREGKWDRAIGFEPGTHLFPRGIDDYGAESWSSPFPNLDIRHDKNLTPSRWSPEQFRNPRYARGWTVSDTIEGWGKIGGQFDKFLETI